jgi:CubicO group peptidase (beta-lactamase class C family)
MSSGLEWHESAATYGGSANDETRLFWDWSPVHFVLSRPIAAPAGDHFNYNGGNTTVIADVLMRTAKMPLREFARSNLFEPLGITDWEWIGDLYGRPAAFAGLRLKPRDLLKIGRMMLNAGQWQGRQIIAPDWIAQSLREHIPTGGHLGYGYFWWTGTVPWHGTQVPWGAAFGNGGQRLFLVPALDLAVAMTAGAYNDPRIAKTEMRVFEQIIAAVQR